MNTLAEKYYLKAKDGYPLDLAGTLENLEYALSYDEQHLGALHMMGNLYIDQLNNYQVGISYLRTAFEEDPNNSGVGMDLANAYMEIYEVEQAKTLLDYLQGIPEIDKARLRVLEAFYYERRGQYAYALKLLLSAREFSFNGGYDEFLRGQIERVKKKRKVMKRVRRQMV